MSTTVILRADGTARSDAAIRLLEAHRQVYVNHGWRALLRLVTAETATADGVRVVVEFPETIDPRCLGAVPGALANAGIIKRIGFVPTSRLEPHARLVSLSGLADRETANRWLIEHPDQPDPMPDHKKERRQQLPLRGVV